VDKNLGPDVGLALVAIAAELGVDPDTLPAGIVGILRAFGAARYGEGARDWLLSQGHPRRKTNKGWPAPVRTHLHRVIRDDETTPVIGRHGRRRRRDDGGDDDGGGNVA